MRRSLILLGLFSATPVALQAHLVQSGFGRFYDGMLHVVVTPTDVIVVLGIGLLAGLRGRAEARAAVALLPLGWLLGGIIGLSQATVVAPVWPTIVTVGFAGVLVAADVRLTRMHVAALAAVTGAVHGWSTGSGAASGSGGGLALLGAAVTVGIAVTLIAAGVLGLKAPWARIVVRVVGSWLAAISMLMAGWWLKGVG